MNTKRKTTCDVWFIYRPETDSFMAQLLQHDLEKQGFRCGPNSSWPGTDRLDPELLSIIESAPAFILLLSSGALDRCVDEEDRMRREILAAVDSGKTIVPVMRGGYVWPQQWDERIPEQIRSLQERSSVSASPKYTRTVLDQIICSLPATTLLRPILPTDTIDFFDTAMDAIPNPVSVDLAFHAGRQWRKNPDKMELLQDLLRKKIQLRILLNYPQVIASIVHEANYSFRSPSDLEENLQSWIDLEKTCPELIDVRVCPFPMLHRSYIVRGEEDGYASVRIYTYSSLNPEDGQRCSFSSSAPEYDLYEDEFDDLWTRSESAKSLQLGAGRGKRK